MAYESAYHCDICSCCGLNQRVFTLLEQEQALVRKLIQFVRRNSHWDQDQNKEKFACAFCLERVHAFKSLLKLILINGGFAPKQTLNATKTMQDDGGEEKKEEEHSNKFNCKCSDCQKKFGSLPLLVEVIEQEQESASELSRSRLEPQPSTSRESPPKLKKEMKCAHCKKKFTHKGDLNKHLRTHTGEQPFVCSICNRKFAHTSNLSRHLRLHSGSRPFRCEICKKEFSRKDKFELHKKNKVCKESSSSSSSK